ncbi:MAG: helix-turn-helix domain-containing protein [Clostridiales bacterium]|nr:helix-turn-helix domain-containing protein [Clostridiales bacterium]
MFEQADDIVSIEEMCELLRIGKNTAYKLLTSGKVKAFREGRVWKVPRIALESYVLTSIGFK